ncbi:MAG TPA: LPS assembly lipoprotein LptE [Azospirillaceae bacterium]|nr:LPS assembly lipoprotein LptE [Azospirillaceae bacterium]
MWWSSRILLRASIAASLLGLAGCGFHPVYGERANDPVAAAQLNRINIANIPNQTGQRLRNLLMDRLYTAGRPDSEDYRLAIRLNAVERKTGIRQDATATRALVSLSAPFQLIETATNKVLYRSSSEVRVSYNVLDAPFATLSGKEFAYERGLIFLADDIRTRVALYFARDPQADIEPVVGELAE